MINSTFCHRLDPFENRGPDVTDFGDVGGQPGSESEHSDQESVTVQTPPIKLAMWVGFLQYFTPERR